MTSSVLTLKEEAFFFLPLLGQDLYNILPFPLHVSRTVVNFMLSEWIFHCLYFSEATEALCVFYGKTGVKNPQEGGTWLA